MRDHCRRESAAVKAVLVVAVAALGLASVGCSRSPRSVVAVSHAAAPPVSPASTAEVTELPQIRAILSDKHYVNLEIAVALIPGTKASAFSASTAAQVIRASLASEVVADVSPATTTNLERLSGRFKATFDKTYPGRVARVFVLQMEVQ
jgi:hypothetical protein